jgi:hypothetical protein
VLTTISTGGASRRPAASTTGRLRGVPGAGRRRRPARRAAHRAGGRARRPAGDDGRRERRPLLRAGAPRRRAVGYSVALGAFLAGALVAESGEGATVEHLVQPVRDIFAAIFFVAVGMLISPSLIAEHWAAVAGADAGGHRGHGSSASRTGVFLTGEGIRTSIKAGLSLAQIGEFSFIIAGVGLSTGRPGRSCIRWRSRCRR